MSETGKQHPQEDHECMIFLGDEVVAFDSIDSAIDALASAGILKDDEAERNRFAIYTESLVSGRE
jgi:hypothetical protein